MSHPKPTPATATSALREFLRTEVAGGLVLLVATVVALVWANSPWGDGYDDLWSTHVELPIGSWHLDLDLRQWVGDGLMTFFFLVVGLEIKRELVTGELRDPRRAALPVAAALGGMVVPALLYALVNAGGNGSRGWGIPMATDLAFALGVLAVVAPRIPTTLRLFLLTLAIVDDIGAVLVIAVFYSEGVDPAWLAVATVAVIAMAVSRRMGVASTALFVVLGTVTWLGLHEGGVHPTLAGVTTGLLVPVASTMRRPRFSAPVWQHVLHPWSSLVVVPLFALANAGIHLDGNALTDGVTSPVTAGVVLGLVVGKTVGITAGAWLSSRLGVATRPAGVTWPQLVGVAALGGIGFTVSILVSGLAFDDPRLVDEAKVGVLVASVLASSLGALLLRSAGRRTASDRP